jgi:hypothetical protein
VPSPLDLLNRHALKPIGEFSLLSSDEILGKAPTRRWFQDWREWVPGDLQSAERKLQRAQSFSSEANLRLIV